MGSSKKHKKHKDRKHSSQHDESNQSFNSISNNSVISGEQGTLKLVLRVPGASNSPHMSPSVITQEYNQEHPHISFTGLEGSMTDGRPYSSSSSKKMKKKKSKKKHKKHSHHHHSHHHSHHKHRSSCSHHSSKHSTSVEIANSASLVPITNQLQSPPQQVQQQTQIQPQFIMPMSSMNEFSQDQPPRPAIESSTQLAIEPTPQSTHQPTLISTQQSTQINQQFSPNLLPPNLPNVTMSSLSQQVLEQPMNTTPITSPTNSCAMSNDANLSSSIFNANNFTNNYSTCNLMSNNMINPVVSPLSSNSYVSNVPQQPLQQQISEMDIPISLNQYSLPAQIPIVSLPTSIQPTSIQSATIQPTSIQTSSMQQPQTTTTIMHHQPSQLIRAPIGVKPLVKTQFQSLLGYLLKQLEKRDSQEFFFWPVTDLIAPGYSSIITKPMDFSKIRHKINLNSYENLIQFRSDVKLMCDNAMTYNRPDTIYYKAARKLWHFAKDKIFSRDSVLELVKLYQGVTNYELGLTCADYTDSEQIDTVPNYADFSQMSEQLTPEQQAQFQLINKPIKKLNVSEDQMTPDEILDEVRKTAQEAADRLSLAKPNGSHYTLLRQLEDGTTTLAIVGSNVNGYQEEKYVNLESIVGKLNDGLPHLPGFKESDLNTVKPIDSIPTSPFSSYLPNSDSSKANLTEKETALLYSSYGDETGLTYAESLLKFASGSDYVLTMVDSLLDALTNGQHTKVLDELKANQAEELKESSKDESDDVEMKDAEQTEEEDKKENDLDEKLNETSSLVCNLKTIQTQRLSSSTVPVKPGKEEVKIADLLWKKLSDLIGAYTTPADVSDHKSIRKALGVQVKSEFLNT